MRDFTNIQSILISDLSMMQSIYFRLFSEAIKILSTMKMTLKGVEIIVEYLVARMGKKEN